MLSRKACLNCRRRHIKCDEETPTCRRCRVADLKCEHRFVHGFRTISFDHLEHSPSNEQTEAEPKPELSQNASDAQTKTKIGSGAFVDETSSIIEAHQTLSAYSPLPTLSPSASYSFNNPPTIVGLPLAATVHKLPPWEEALGNTLFPTSEDPIVNNHHTPGASPQLPRVLKGHNENPQYDRLLDTTPSPSSPNIPRTNSPPPLSSPRLSHPREAYLLKVFTQTWGPIFDCLDPDSTFTKSILHIATTSFQPLLWAMLATSALQLSRISDYPFEAAEYYRSRCSKSIVPLLLQETVPEVGEEALLATYVMLRNYEQMMEKLSEKNPENLFTAALAISTNPSEMVSDQVDLGRAAFWVHLRQDIHVAMLLQVPVNTDYPPCLQREKILANLDHITSSQNTGMRQEAVDCAWANRMASLLLDIINYCFQDSQPRDIEPWVMLRSRLDYWRIAKPTTFDPYYERARNPSQGRVFPEIWISTDCHVLAWLYYHAANILLKTYPPGTVPKPIHESPNTRNPTLNSLETTEAVLLHARAICGIANTNPNAQALIVFCHLVTISAIFFTDPSEQKETLDLLAMAHAVTGHPRQDVDVKLRNYWGTESNMR